MSKLALLDFPHDHLTCADLTHGHLKYDHWKHVRFHVRLPHGHWRVHSVWVRQGHSWVRL